MELLPLTFECPTHRVDLSDLVMDVLDAQGPAALVGTLIAGLGVLAAGAPGGGSPRAVAGVAVVAAVGAVVLALAAQVLTVARGLRPGNLVEVRAWYRRRFAVRAPLAVAATVLLVVAAAAAGVSAAVRVVAAGPGRPEVAVTRVSGAGADTVTAEVTIHEVTAGEVLTVTIAARGRVLGRAVAVSGTNGTVSRTLTVGQVHAGDPVTVVAIVGDQNCAVAVGQGSQPQLSCHRG